MKSLIHVRMHHHFLQANSKTKALQKIQLEYSYTLNFKIIHIHISQTNSLLA